MLSQSDTGNWTFSSHPTALLHRPLPGTSYSLKLKKQLLFCPFSNSSVKRKGRCQTSLNQVMLCYQTIGISVKSQLFSHKRLSIFLPLMWKYSILSISSPVFFLFFFLVLKYGIMNDVDISLMYSWHTIGMFKWSSKRCAFYSVLKNCYFVWCFP